MIVIASVDNDEDDYGDDDDDDDDDDDKNKRSCGFCGKIFSTVGSRRRHERDRHVDPGSLPCHLCGKWCKNRGALIKHRSTVHRPAIPPGPDPAPAPVLVHTPCVPHNSATPLLPAPPPITAPPLSPPLPLDTFEGDPLVGLGGELERAYHQFM
ncbi:hypothetical protein Pcinc_027528 [Petrolisthes cinctipes]|uniref:C2H2-type domain-containing protein n=1 Tax=Petrolisthes cinctipes TaxID=88211 RepID=A0AAE1F4Q1_PETCI|nr:hypothetical protein Pcinc_027528 [Petrolisthes cinctipes]